MKNPDLKAEEVKMDEYSVKKIIIPKPEKSRYRIIDMCERNSFSHCAIVDGGTLTSKCMWEGIVVHGDKTVSQVGTSCCANQGKVVIKNGSTIENAHAVLLAEPQHRLGPIEPVRSTAGGSTGSSTWALRSVLSVFAMDSK